MLKRLHHLAAALIAGLVYLAGGFEVAEHHLIDLRFRLLRQAPQTHPVVVAIDPKSLAALDVWPWPRGYHATVLENLEKAGASSVAFDLDFSSRSDPDEDRTFSEALARAGGEVILPVFRQWNDGGSADPELVVSGPLPSFRHSTKLASINIQPGRGGLVRKYWPVDSVLSDRTPSLALAVSDWRGPIPDSFYLDFSIDPESIHRISYLDLLTGQFDPGLVVDRPVIVGATAVELGDQVAVPIHRTLPGPILQALAVESLEQGRALQRSDPMVGVLAALLLGLAFGWQIEQSSWQRGLLFVAGGWVLIFATSLVVQISTPVLLDVMPSSMSIFFSYGIGLVRRIDQQSLKLIMQAIQMRDSETTMQHVVASSSEAIITASAEGRIETFNAAAERVFGYKAGEILTRPISEILPDGLDAPGVDEPRGRHPLRQERAGLKRSGARILTELTCTTFEIEGRARQVILLRDITRRKAQEQALEHQATHDSLTDLPNRVMLRRKVEEALAVARVEGTPVAFLILDLDRFKEVNDTLGHHAGDLLLKQIAERLRRPLGQAHTIARLGGDEFAILLPSANREEAREMATRLIQQLKDPFDLEGLALQVDMSIGISMYPEHGAEADILIQRADVAMYIAKKVRNTTAVYDPDQDYNSVRHLTLKGELQRAVEEDHLVLHFQPKISSRGGSIEGVEALVRWQHPEHGVLLPGEFVPMAEHTGLIKPITFWVLEEGLRQCARWRERGLDLSIAINCSARNLLQEDLPENVLARLRRYGIPAEMLVLEITETAIIEDPARALDVLTALAGLGVRISIDDFGTGYSSLEYLRRLPATELKIDRSFVKSMDTEAGNEVIVRSTIDLAHNLNLLAVAEGVESEAIWTKLRGLNCDLAQGYYFGRPMTASELDAWLEDSAWGMPGGEDRSSVAGPAVGVLIGIER